MPSAKPSLKTMARDAKHKKISTSAKPKKTSKPVATDFKSTEFVQESDDEDVNNNTAPEDESDSENDSLPENPSDAARESAKLPPPSGSSSSSENESSENENENIEHESSEGEEETDDAPEADAQAEPSRYEHPIGLFLSIH